MRHRLRVGQGGIADSTCEGSKSPMATAPPRFKSRKEGCQVEPDYALMGVGLDAVLRGVA